MKCRKFIGVGLFMLAVVIAGCETSSGGQDGATEEQKKDPAWVRQRLNELDRDPTIPKTKPATAK
ncbi:hypothetical protein SAMN05444166_6076 [Singulisphaera sp. GP187]|uniref:hypothetical protein n=1 Tax=Singulisphaera sp. GP187 TaxID=1882752 RepID=UPI000927A214|nr:hypothetical protein [Singulisphaera sp. GP187]SIO59506.1 hypothetical protein SAMN05444166_6076 [Singulisphaera sp. GP187]